MGRGIRYLVLLIPVLLPIPALLGQGPPEGQGPPGPVPDKVCVKCHKEIAVQTTSHRILARLHPDGACEACHGPAKAHVEDPFSVPLTKSLDASGKAALCLTCHRGFPDHAANWETTDFAKSGQTCAECHKPHETSEARPAYDGDAKGFLGDGACRLCHGPVFAGLANSFHADVLGMPGAGCEACHGAGSAHAKGALALAEGKGPAGITREPAGSECLLCHRAVPERHAREMPVYAEKRPACTVCHDVHIDRNDPIFATDGPLPASSSGKCGSAACEACHVSSVASARSSVHAALLAEGGAGCEACHGPAMAHVRSGGRARFVFDPLSRTPAEASAMCLNCHAEAPDHARDWKGGPLAAKGLSCLTCHEAHGAAEGQGRPITAGGTPVVSGKSVGSSTCAICHADAHPGIGMSVHAALMADPKAAGCESCHGPGSAHVLGAGSRDAIRNPGRLPKEQQSGFCLTCHGSNPSLSAFARGDHGRTGLACTTCHDPLRGPADSPLKREPDLCYACHGDVKAKFALPNHHPLEEGAVRCVSCHDPHGSPPGILSLETRKEKCFECHVDKRGPFLYEHEADRQEGCVVCHLPHGSPNRRLLTHRDVRSLCIQCHVTPSNHDLAEGSAFRNCLNCHGSIHGSYVDDGFFR